MSSTRELTTLCLRHGRRWRPRPHVTPKKRKKTPVRLWGTFTFDSDEEDEEGDDEGTKGGAGETAEEEGFKFEAECNELKLCIVEGVDLGQFVRGRGIAGF